MFAGSFDLYHSISVPIYFIGFDKITFFTISVSATFIMYHDDIRFSIVYNKNLNLNNKVTFSSYLYDTYYVMYY